MEEKLLEIVSIVLGIDKNNINLNTNREDIEEWDSLNHIRLVAEVEEYFGISIPFESTLEISKIADFMEYIK